eukprot:865375-Pyramimonas_sp.AAC.1
MRALNQFSLFIGGCLPGVLVLDATPGGPAARAGVQTTKRDTYGRLVLGDIITGINNDVVKNSSDLYRCAPPPH